MTLMDVKKEAALRATSLFMLLLITASGTLQALYTSRVQPYHVAYLASTSASNLPRGELPYPSMGQHHEQPEQIGRAHV